MASALSRMVLQVKVLILFRVEKLPSDSDVVMGVVMMILSSLTVSAKAASKLFSWIDDSCDGWNFPRVRWQIQLGLQKTPSKGSPWQSAAVEKWDLAGVPASTCSSPAQRKTATDYGDCEPVPVDKPNCFNTHSRWTRSCWHFGWSTT